MDMNALHGLGMRAFEFVERNAGVKSLLISVTDEFDGRLQCHTTAEMVDGSKVSVMVVESPNGAEMTSEVV